jgi:hypothetical protein
LPRATRDRSVFSPDGGVRPIRQASTAGCFRVRRRYR